MKVLVVEDDDLTRAGLLEILENEGYHPLGAENGEVGLKMAAEHAPEVVCLDVMMPKVDGYEVCRRLRASGSEAAILFISAKGEEVDKVVGLELGADDFIVKPFGVREVVARIRAVTRRLCRTQANVGGAGAGAGERRGEFALGDLEVFPQELRARRGGEMIDLSLRDVKLLELFYLNPGKALDRNEIFNAVWGQDYYPNSRTLDQHISQLRKRIEVDPSSPALIQTVHGVGYRYDEELT